MRNNDFDFLNKAKTFSIVTLGCKVNQSESDMLYSGLLKKGYIYLFEPDKADIVFVNTCAVTKEAEAKTRKIVRRALKSSAKTVAVIGCAAPLVKEKLLEEANENLNLIFLDNREKQEFLNWIEKSRPEEPALKNFPRLRTRAFVKIQDGCNRRCTYCIVPLLRGKEVSVPKEEIFKRLKELEEKSVKEIVLTGVHLGKYKGDEKNYGLAELLTDIASKFSFRVRLSSLDVFEISEKLIKTIAELKGVVCPHFHIPLQSGSNRILELMNRPYTREQYLEKIEKLKEVEEIVAFSTDVMVGFPTETKEDFLQTVDVIQKTGFMKLHVFRYSERPGTEATLFEPKVSESEKKKREKELIALSEKLTEDFKKKLCGRVAHALIEEEENGHYIGKTEFYLDVKISQPVEKNNIYKVKISYEDGELIGEVV